ncbi:IS1380 family transposase [candidate division Kazan bacterium]|uniref:IS1380 family transposase n=1 Tax=candidate division Kazan bacterium TaxID=2202143 RepID=A0A420ZBE1_UNCK3|nr:MAG: IS1380 family transposase [candidate division Kazan bacterium]
MELKIDFTDKEITPWGGMVLLKNMLDRIKFAQVIESCNDLPSGGSNRSYSTRVIIESFIVNVWCGATRFLHTEIGRHDYPLARIFNWGRHPAQDTYKRFFKRFDWGINTRVFSYFYQWFFRNLRMDEATLDIDSSIFTRYGKQEGSRKGYNPKKPGRASHHPLLAFVADVNMVANFWLRRGDSYTTNNFTGFLEETLSNLAGIKVGLIRLDSGFYDKNILEYLEKKPMNYIIAVRFYSPIKQLLRSKQNWIRLSEGVEVATTEYQSPVWNKPRKLILVRQDIKVRPGATGKQLRLKFEENDVAYYRHYRYSAYVTNMTLPAAEVWRLYRHRAEAENRIKELDYDFGLNAFNLNEFFATEAALNFVMVAYNLMNLFRRFIMTEKVQKRLSSIRYNTFAIGAYLTRDGRYMILKLALKLKRREWFTGIWNYSRQFEYPFIFSNA